VGTKIQPYKKKIHILLLSDATGETVNSIASILASQFPESELSFELIPFLRTIEKADQILKTKYGNTDVIIHTLVDKTLIEWITSTCKTQDIKIIEILSNPLNQISQIVNKSPIRVPGQQYKVNTQYFNRIDAIDFAIYTDDGQTGERLLLSDVIVLGISRTSKTPTCIYLAYQGIRAANVPLVLNQKLPKNFYLALEKGIPAIGLIASTTRLKEIRSNRLKTLGNTNVPNYVDINKIQEELIFARLFFERYKIPVLDVTRRSIEETAAAIKVLINK